MLQRAANCRSVLLWVNERFARYQICWDGADVDVFLWILCWFSLSIGYVFLRKESWIIRCYLFLRLELCARGFVEPISRFARKRIFRKGNQAFFVSSSGIVLTFRSKIFFLAKKLSSTKILVLILTILWRTMLPNTIRDRVQWQLNVDRFDRKLIQCNSPNHNRSKELFLDCLPR